MVWLTGQPVGDGHGPSSRWGHRCWSVLLPLALLYSKSFDLLTLGEAKAATLGVNVSRDRFLLLGLAVPAGGRGGGHCRADCLPGAGGAAPGAQAGGWTAPGAAAGSHADSAIILQVSDIAVRAIKPPLELPAGIFTALIGAPYFFYLLRRSL